MHTDVNQWDLIEKYHQNTKWVLCLICELL